MITLTGIPGRTAKVNGKEYLFFSGFAYLGMPFLSAFQHLIFEGIQTYGAVFPSSRISNTRTTLYEQFEEKLSFFIGLPASVSFSSGYMASQAAVAFAAKNSTLLYSPGIHPSLINNGYSAVTLSEENWQQETLNKINTTKQPYTVIMESVNPLSGKVHDFSWMEAIRNPVNVLIDDSHGIGILGKQGEGVTSMLPENENLRYLICYSLAKAFSCEGGAISGEKEDILKIKKLPYFTASTPMSPASVHAWMQSQELFARQLIQLKKNISFLEKNLTNIPQIQHDTRLPVWRITTPDIDQHCLKHHIILSTFRYPSEQDPLVARIVLNALHTPEDLEKLSNCIGNYYSGS